MEMISKAITDGTMQSLSEQPSKERTMRLEDLISEPMPSHKAEPMNRAERRAAEAKERHQAGKVRAARQRRSRGKVPA